MADTLDRRLIDLLAGGNPRLREGLEALVTQVETVAETQTANVAATSKLEDATVLTLSANDALKNERILAVGKGLVLVDDGGRLVIRFSDGAILSSGGFEVNLVPQGDCAVVLPLSGTLATLAGEETLANKTMASPKLSGVGDYADDAAAASGGVPVGGVYRTGSALKVRVA